MLLWWPPRYPLYTIPITSLVHLSKFNTKEDGSNFCSVFSMIILSKKFTKPTNIPILLINSNPLKRRRAPYTMRLHDELYALRNIDSRYTRTQIHCPSMRRKDRCSQVTSVKMYHFCDFLSVLHECEYRCLKQQPTVMKTSKIFAYLAYTLIIISL